MRTSLLVFLLLLSGALPLVAQNRVVTGRVTAAEDGSALPGVNVVIKGTVQGTTTDAAGNYSLTVAPETVLVFSFVGFVIQEIAVGEQTTLNVSLLSDAQTLGEVVVTAIGLEADRDKLGTSVSTVKGNQVVQSGESSLINGLAAKSPGVLIQRSTGDPGASANIQIRGQSSITGNLQPLIVIDGIPVTNSSIGDAGIIGGTGEQSNQTTGVMQQSRLNDINPDDIASVEVYKGASAAALWGTRAANGVIVITTKRGRRGDKLDISLRSSYSFDEVNKLPQLQRNYGQGINGQYRGTSSNANSWGDKIADRSGGPDDFITEGEPGYQGFVTLPDGSRRYAIAPGTASNPHGGKNSRETFDHAKEVFQTGHTRDNTLSFGGGDQKSTFYVSLGNTYTEGIIRNNSDYHRTTFRLNADRQLSTRFKAGTTFTYSDVRSKRGQMGSNTSGIFLAGLRTAPDFDNQFYYGDYTDPNGVVFQNRQISYRNALGRDVVAGSNPPIGNARYDNPFFIINRILNTSNVRRLVGSLELTYDVTDWLSIVNRTGLDTYRDRRRADFPIGAASAPTGSLREEEIAETQLNNDFFVRASRSLGANFGGSLLLGGNLNERRADQVGVIATNLINPYSPPQLGNSPATARSVFNLSSIIRTGAFYGQADVEVLDMLYLTLTGRLESASTFGSAQSTFFYPSAALAWQFTKLSAFGDSPLNFGKLRVAVGQVGVQPNPYQTRTYLGPADLNAVADNWGTTLDASAYGGGFVRSTNKGNPDLRPEQKSEVETGLDLRFLNNRISLSGSFYANETKDVILPIPVAGTTGYLTQTANAARISNRGVELELNADVVKVGGFTWTLSPNWSRNRNRVEDLQGATNILLNGFAGNSVNPSAVQGYQLGALFGSRTLRGENGQPVLDANGFLQLDPVSGIVGDPNPQWRSGIGNTFRYNNLSLYVLVDHVHQFDVWNGTRGVLYVFGTHADVGNEVTVSAAEAAQIRNYNGLTVAQFGRANADGTYSFRGNLGDFGGGRVALDQSWYQNIGGGFNGPGDQFVERINTTRLREATLAYSLNTAGFRRFSRLQSVEFAVTSRNLVLWTDYKGVDPETNLTGVSNGRGLDYYNNPNTRSLLFSIRVNY